MALACTARGAVPQAAPPQAIGVAELPYGFSEQIVATGLDVATAMAVAPDGRVFVCEQTGALRLVKDDWLAERPVLKLEVDPYWERGLIGIALDPSFTETGYIYLCYVAREPYPHHVVSRFTLDGDVVIPESEKVLLVGDDQSQLGGSVPAGHQGGVMCFGPDGKLYIGLGEQTAGGPSQRLDSLLGKLLRINPDGTIPEDNPFYGQTPGKYRAIYARGIRNPFGLAVQPSTGRMFINDVGGNRWEEINEAKPGANYGWPNSEGPTTHPDHTPPLYAYAEGGQQSITGGVFYEQSHGVALQFPPEYHGKYFFAEYSDGWIRVLDPAHPTDVQTFATEMHRPVALALAPDGSLYYLNRNEWVKNESYVGRSSSLHRIFYTTAADRPAPRVTTFARDIVAALDRPMTLEVEATGEPPLSYQWQRDGKPIDGADAPCLAIDAAQKEHDGGTYRCVVSNRHGTTKSPLIRVWTADLAPPVDVPRVEPGVSFAAFACQGDALPDFATTHAFAVGAAQELQPAQGFEPQTPPGIALLYPVYLRVPADSVYTFRLDTSGIAKLIVAGREIIVTRGTKAPRYVEGHVGLQAGFHPLLLLTAESPTQPRFDLRISGEGMNDRRVDELLVHTGDAMNWIPAITTEPDDASGREAWEQVSQGRRLALSLAIPKGAADLPPLLSQTGAFRSLNTLEPTSGVVPYEVNLPLWSDAADKERWIALPGAAQIDAASEDEWRYPPGTVFIKHFELAGRRLETRFLYVERGGHGWGATYRWREDGTDAELIDDAIDEQITYAAGGHTHHKRWYFPSRTDCLACHTESAGFVLGAAARQLAGAGNDSLERWKRLEMLVPRHRSNDAADPPLAALLDASASLEHRVRSYLDANCAHCHRPGVVRASFDARITTPLAQQKLIGGDLLSADLGVRGAKLVVPGDPAKSMLYLRLTRRGDAYAMPPLASHEVDEEAARLIAEWIKSL